MALNFTTIFNEVCKELQTNGKVTEMSTEFQTFKTDIERYTFVHKLPELQDKVKFKEENQKNKEKSVEFKELGNSAYKAGNIKKSINYYTNSIASAPDEDTSCIGFANRSAALFHIGEYDAAIRDITRALSQGYPNPDKLQDRKAKCVKLAAEQRVDGFNEDENSNKLDSITISNDNEDSSEHGLIPNLDFGASTQIPSASSALHLQDSLEIGRHFIADRDIPVGSVLVVERPYSSILLSSSWETHCYQCYSRLRPDVIPCDGCTEVMFCDVDCMKAAKSYHQYECKQIHTQKNNSFNKIFPRLAYRIVTDSGISVLDEAVNCENAEFPEVYKSADYSNIYNIVGHSSQRSVSDLFHRSVQAFYLVQMLKSCGFFNKQCFIHNQTDLYGETCEECEMVAGGVLLRHLQNLPCNAHEINELVDDQQKVQLSSVVEIGAAAYATFSLFNHSCDPNVVRHYYKDTGVIRAIRPIKKGEEIVDNYSNHYATHHKSDRQKHLLDQYYFQCNCVPCEKDWPKYDHLTTKLKWVCSNCGYRIPSKSTTWCRCGSEVNVQSIESSVNKSRDKYLEVIGKVLDRDGMGALPVLHSHLGLLDKVVQRPYKEYNDCQEIIKLCYSVLGNYHRENM